MKELRRRQPVQCPTCQRLVNPITLHERGCSTCLTETIRKKVKPYKLKMDDVRAQRLRVLQNSDWVNSSDLPEELKARYRGLRQKIRDVTKYRTASRALKTLNKLEQEINQL